MIISVGWLRLQPEESALSITVRPGKRALHVMNVRRAELCNGKRKSQWNDASDLWLETFGMRKTSGK